MISFHKNPDLYMASLTGGHPGFGENPEDRPEPPGDSVELSPQALAHLDDDF